ncbi:hypothetical protein KDL01_41230 [Actinospica durhamensis]|uniref:Uncharacterized protein n=1 Tax=Actinospica durhamensis TaxID=1508375 RepID=A0A941IUW7_9ACTN|nr:hypothetical protein [Actinospica durhamensis]MBR7839742.1 hypothetical protein [Actinospica durhamensis]
MGRVGITGHRGLSADVAERVIAMLRAELGDAAPGEGELVGVTCLADGADTLFAREVLARGGSLEVIVPAGTYRESLPGSHHADYDEIIGLASEVHELAYVESGSEAYMAASVLMLTIIGELIAVWDGQPARGYGGTAEVVGEARERGVPVRVVWPEGAVRAV